MITNVTFVVFFYNFFHYWCIYFDLVAFPTVVAFNRFPERGSIHTVAFHRLALAGRGINLGGFSHYDRLFSYVFLKELRTSVENSFVERWWGHLLNWINLFSHSHVKLVPNDLGGANFSNLCIQKFLAKYIEEISKLKKFMSNSRDFVQIINIGIGMYISYYCFKIQHIAQC